MKSQAELIRETDWDVLLVLDACRYDYFEKYYRYFFDNTGRLQKCISSSTFTFGWFMSCFDKSLGATLVCSEPITDSIKDITNKLKHGNTVDVNKYFTNVVDIYSTEWKEPGLIYPLPIFNAITDLIENGEKRIVAKFIQLHDPYVYWLERGEDGCRYNQIIKGNFRKLLYEVMSDEMYWTILDKLGLPPEHWLNYIWLKYGKEGIIEGYYYDLLMMLGMCKELIERYPDRRFVITSDHGERLGERGRYSHGGKRTRTIKEVPWYEVRRHVRH